MCDNRGSSFQFPISNRGRAEPGRTPQVYESYITGMLSNFSALPLGRVHNMLLMFCAHGDHVYDKSEEQLRAFLRR